MHRPWSASQPLGHCGSQQSAPPQPWWHSHETGSPWSPGSEGMQVECASWATGGALMAPSAPSAPVDVFPAKRLTRPAEQRLPLQSKPPHGARHWHTLGALPARIARASVGADALAMSAARLVADGFGAIGARPARRTSASVGAHTRPTAACTRAVVQAAWLAARGAAVALVAAAHVGNEAPAVPPAVEAVGNLARIARVPRGARASTPIAIAHAVGRAVVRAAHPNRAIGAAPAGRAQALAIVAVATSRAVVCAQAR